MASTAQKALDGVAWLSLFKVISQTCSWIATIFIARILSTRDYGLMEMATVFTGYVQFFVEFGIGAAIINQKEIKTPQLSSIFWFLLFWGCLLGGSCLALAPVTVWFFEEEAVGPLTQTVGLIFVISSMVILPRSLLDKELRFKAIGCVDALAVITSSAIMILCALKGAGVWTLLIGYITRELCKLCLFYSVTTFRPKFHFSYEEVKPIVNFGLPVVGSQSLFYIYTKADRFFGGKAFPASELGLYGMALQLASMPVEKIVSLLQTVLYPTLSRVQHDRNQFNKFLLSFISIISCLTMPLFIGGYLYSDPLIPLLIGEKWRPSIPSFQLLLIAQLIVSLSSPLALVHTALGKPSTVFKANIILCPLLFAGFFFSARLGSIDYLGIPWVTIYPLFQIGFLVYSLRVLNISISTFLKAIYHPCIATALMILACVLVSDTSDNTITNLLIGITVGAFSYGIYMLSFGKSLINGIVSLRNEEE